MGLRRFSSMPKYTVFFDESGDEHIKVFAGFVSANEQWDRFEVEWRRVLGRFNAPPLHTRTFAHSIGEFAESKGDEPRRQAFLTAVVRKNSGRAATAASKSRGWIKKAGARLSSIKGNIAEIDFEDRLLSKMV